MHKYVRLFIFLGLVLILLWDCTSERYFPNFTINSYITDKSTSVSGIIRDKTVIIWMPLNSCGICIESTIECLKDKKNDFTGLVITTNSNQLQYNWIRLNIKKLRTSKMYFYVNLDDDTNSNLFVKKFYKKNKFPEIFMVNKDCKIIKSNLLGGKKEEISDIIKTY